MKARSDLKEAPAEDMARLASNVTRQPVLAVPVFMAVGVAGAGIAGVTWAAGCLMATTALPLLYLVYLKRTGQVQNPGDIRRTERGGPLWIVTVLWLITFVFFALGGIPAGLRATLLAYVLVTPAFAVLTRYTNPSLHAAGAAWATVCLVNIFGPLALGVSVLLPLVWWARITLGRHSLPELVVGTLLGGCLTQLAFYLAS